MYLLLDECCPKSLIAVAEGLGHTAQRTIAVAGLGPQASDAAIFAFACVTGAVVVTVNRGDFVALARRRGDHCGLIFLTSVPPAEMRRLFRLTLIAGSFGEPGPGPLCTIDASGQLTIETA